MTLKAKRIILYAKNRESNIKDGDDSLSSEHKYFPYVLGPANKPHT